MNQFPLQKLIDLVEFDQKIVQIEHAIAKLKAEIDAAQSEIDLCNEGVERFKLDKHTLKKEVDATEFEMKTLDEQEKDKRRRLDSATNQREYESFSKEIERLQRLQNDLEEDLLQKWKKYEHAEDELVERQSFCDAKVISLNTAIQEKMQQVAELEKEFKQEQNARQEKLQGIPEELLERYLVMYKQVSNPVVPVAKESCSACFYPLTQQNLYDLRRRKLLQCRDCFRFLYDKDAHEALQDA